MDRTYDIFEKFPNGQVLWRVAIVGREQALSKLQELAAASGSELFAKHIPTGEIIAAPNITTPPALAS